MVAELAQVNDRDGASGGLDLGGGEGDELVNVDGGAERVVGLLVVVPHTNLAKVTGVVLVKVGAVVVLTTGETATTRMLAVLADTTVTGRDVAAVLAGVGETGGHLSGGRRQVSGRVHRTGRNGRREGGETRGAGRAASTARSAQKPRQDREGVWITEAVKGLRAV